MAVELIRPDIYKIDVPLPNNPLRALNSYVITSGERPVLVDLGFDRPECSEAIFAGLAELGIAPGTFDIFITHAHPDHTGSINRVWQPGMTVWAGFPSFAYLRCYYHSHNRGFHLWMGDSFELLPEGQTMPWLSAEEERKVLANEYDYTDMGDIVMPMSPAPVTLLADCDVLNLGSRTFRVIHTLGHDPHHLCLFDAADGTLISGDQVLQKITPNIVSFALGENLLRDYLASLNYLDTFPVQHVLTGHRGLYDDLHARTAELRAHHAARTAEMLAALGAGYATVKDIARNVTWNNPIPNWDDWPDKQKYFSIGETIVHLTYLEALGLVSHEIDNRRISFRLS